MSSKPIGFMGYLASKPSRAALPPHPAPRRLPRRWVRSCPRRRDGQQSSRPAQLVGGFGVVWGVGLVSCFFWRERWPPTFCGRKKKKHDLEVGYISNQPLTSRFFSTAPATRVCAHILHEQTIRYTGKESQKMRKQEGAGIESRQKKKLFEMTATPWLLTPIAFLQLSDCRMSTHSHRWKSTILQANTKSIKQLWVEDLQQLVESQAEISEVYCESTSQLLLFLRRSFLMKAPSRAP